MSAVALKVNGRRLHADVAPRTHLADLLRETHNLTGTHIGCEHGVCGACTVLADGAPIRSCITYAVTCDEARITTIEGLDTDEIATALREAFGREHGLQCGYCTPGMIIAARDVVLRLASPSEKDIRIAMSGNLCRCTGYVGIIRAIEGVIADRRARGIAAVPGGDRCRLGPAGSGNADAAMPPSPPTGVREHAPSTMPSEPTALDPSWMPQTILHQTFEVSHSAEAVWAFFGRIREVAACLPGATVDSLSDDRVTGRIRVKAGPIQAAFAGMAHVKRDEALRTGTIDGTGQDAKTKSATRGRISYGVNAIGSGARIDVELGFTLTGVLAQFGRSGLMQDVANRLTAAFAANLETRLAGGSAPAGPPAPAAELDAGSMLFAVARDWLRAAWDRLFRRRSS